MSPEPVNPNRPKRTFQRRKPLRPLKAAGLSFFTAETAVPGKRPAKTVFSGCEYRFSLYGRKKEGTCATVKMKNRKFRLTAAQLRRTALGAILPDG